MFPLSHNEGPHPDLKDPYEIAGWSLVIVGLSGDDEAHGGYNLVCRNADGFLRARSKALADGRLGLESGIQRLTPCQLHVCDGCDGDTCEEEGVYLTGHDAFGIFLLRLI